MASESGERTRPRVLIAAPRRNVPNRRKVRDGEGAIASTRGACAPQTRLPMKFPRHANSNLPRGVVCRLLAFFCCGDRFDFHPGSFRQSGNLDGGTCRRPLLEIRAINFVDGLEIA